VNRSIRCDAIHAEDLITVKRSIFHVAEDPEDPGGGGCAFRAIATALWLKTYQDGRRHVPLRWVRDHAKQLCERAGLTWGPCGLVELTQLQDVLKEDGVRLHVYYHHLKCVGFSGNWDEFGPEGPLMDIYLFHHDEHYDVIQSMTGFLSVAYYCMRCDVGYQNASNHKCHLVCSCCYFPTSQCVPDDEVVTQWQTCERCHRVFKGDVCFTNHLQAVTSVDKKNKRSLLYSTCDRYQKCARCQCVVDVLKRRKELFVQPEHRHIDDHVCGEVHCLHCKKLGPKHCCFIQPVTDGECPQCHLRVTYPHTCQNVDVLTYEDRVEARYLFFDVETMPCEEVHVVNLVVAHKVCSRCMDRDNDEDVTCDVCQDRRRVFRTRDEFCRWLFRPEHRGFTAGIFVQSRPTSRGDVSGCQTVVHVLEISGHEV